jgi:hypothetical protein
MPPEPTEREREREKTTFYVALGCNMDKSVSERDSPRDYDVQFYITFPKCNIILFHSLSIASFRSKLLDFKPFNVGI